MGLYQQEKFEDEKHEVIKLHSNGIKSTRNSEGGELRKWTFLSLLATTYVPDGNFPQDPKLLQDIQVGDKMRLLGSSSFYSPIDFRPRW